jgi:hypothetical protein
MLRFGHGKTQTFIRTRSNWNQNSRPRRNHKAYRDTGHGGKSVIMTTEIPQKSWDPFCQRLRDWYRGVVSIRWVQPGGALRIVAEGLPLQRFIFQKQNQSCSDTMTVEAGVPDERPMQHQIIEPFRVVLRKNDESGRYDELEILAETGKTEITFTPGLDPTLLDKLAA